MADLHTRELSTGADASGDGGRSRVGFTQFV